jgi:hypothetical protein
MRAVATHSGTLTDDFVASLKNGSGTILWTTRYECVSDIVVEKRIWHHSVDHPL